MKETNTMLKSLGWQNMREEEMYSSFSNENEETFIRVVDLTSIGLHCREHLVALRDMIRDFEDSGITFFLTNAVQWDIFIEGKYRTTLTVPPSPESLPLLKKLYGCNDVVS